jgi:hypothetical protein
MFFTDCWNKQLVSEQIVKCLPCTPALSHTYIFSTRRKNNGDGLCCLQRVHDMYTIYMRGRFSAEKETCTLTSRNDRKSGMKSTLEMFFKTAVLRIQTILDRIRIQPLKKIGSKSDPSKNQIRILLYVKFYTSFCLLKNGL